MEQRPTFLPWHNIVDLGADDLLGCWLRGVCDGWNKHSTSSQSPPVKLATLTWMATVVSLLFPIHGGNVIFKAYSTNGALVSDSEQSWGCWFILCDNLLCTSYTEVVKWATNAILKMWYSWQTISQTKREWDQIGHLPKVPFHLEMALPDLSIVLLSAPSFACCAEQDCSWAAQQEREEYRTNKRTDGGNLDGSVTSCVDRFKYLWQGQPQC